CIVERAPAHICQRRNLDDLPFHIVAELFVRDHVVECVVYGSQVRIDLFFEISGQESQVLASFNRRTRYDDFLDRLALECFYGKRNGDIRLARTCRSQRKHKVIGSNELDKLVLVHGLGTNGRTLRAVDDNIVLRTGSCWHYQFLLTGDVLLYVLLSDPTVLVIMLNQRIQDVIDLYDFRCRTLDQDLITSRDNLAFRKSCGKGIDGLIFYSKKLYERNVVQCYYFFYQRMNPNFYV